MSSRNNDLRRLIVELAALHEDDVVSVLGQLSAKQREKVEALRREFSEFGLGARRLPDNASEPQVDPTRVSAWLLARMDFDDPETHMTPYARKALRDCAARLYPLSSRPPSKRGPFGAFGRVQSLREAKQGL